MPSQHCIAHHFHFTPPAAEVKQYVRLVGLRESEAEEASPGGRTHLDKRVIVVKIDTVVSGRGLLPGFVIDRAGPFGWHSPIPDDGHQGWTVSGSGREAVH